MAFETVASLDADVTVALGKKDKRTGKPYPTSAEGYYLGNRQVQGNRGPSTLHFLQTSKGNLGVWGTTDLDRKLKSVQVGTMTRITSTGTKATPKGDMFTYRVEQDQDNTIEVQVTESQPASDDSGYDAGEDDNSAEEADSAYTPAPAVQMTAAERKAKMDALFSKGKK